MAAVQDVQKATSELLLMPDWDLNLRLSDIASASVGDANEVVRALTKRLAGTKNPKVGQLCLTLADTLVKNGSLAVFAALASNEELLNLFKALATRPALGDEVQKASTELIQNVALAFSDDNGRRNYPFFAIYDDLRAKGVAFPPVDHSAVSSIKPAPIPQPRQQHVPPAAAASSAAPAPQRVVDPRVVEEQMNRALTKLRGDLSGVKRAVAQGARMLSADGGAAANPANGSFLDCIDFLFQCKPRLQDLTEGCISGIITDEAVFEAILSCHEATARVLDAGLPIASLSHPSKARERESFHPRSHPQVSDLVDFDSSGALVGPAPAATASRRGSGPSGPGMAAPSSAAAAAPSSSSSAAAPSSSAAAAAAAGAPHRSALPTVDDDLLGLFSSPAPASSSAAAAAPPLGGARAAATGSGSLTSGPSFSLASFEPTAVGGSHGHGHSATASAAAGAPANPFDSHSTGSTDDSGVGAGAHGSSSAAAAAPSTVAGGAAASADPFASLGGSGSSAKKAPQAAAVAVPAAIISEEPEEEDPFASFSGSHSARASEKQQSQGKAAGGPTSSDVLREVDDVLQ